MLFDVKDLTSDDECAAAIQQAIRAQDPTARVTLKLTDKRVHVEGLLSQCQAIDALARAGYPASRANPHSGEDSDCCGGCS